MVSIQEVQRVVSVYFNVPMKDLLSEKRARQISWPRQIAMWLCSEMTDASVTQVGRKFHRDHTTIMHGISKVRRQLALRDELLERDVRTLMNAVHGKLWINEGEQFPRDYEAEAHAW